MLLLGGALFFEEGIRIVQLGGEGLVTHFLDQDHGRLLVQLLVDGDHLAQLHQLLDYFGSLDRHLVRQIGHGNGFRHVHFLDLHFCRCLEVRLAVATAVVAATAATGTTTRRSAPVATATRAVGTGRAGTDGLEAALLGGVIGPAGRQLLGLDRLLVARLGRGAARSSRCARRADLLVDGALDARSRFSRLGLFLLGRDHHLLGRVHHRADGSSLGLGSLAAAGQVVLLVLLFGSGVDGLDHAQRGLGRLDRGGNHHRGRCFHRRGSDRFRRRHLGRCRLAATARCRLVDRSGLGRRGGRTALAGFGDHLRLGGFSGSQRGGFSSGSSGGFGSGLLRGAARFGGFTRSAFSILAGLHLGGEFLFLLAQCLGLGLGFFLAAHQVGLFGTGRCLVVTLDEGTGLLDLDLDRAGLATGIGLLDLGGRLLDERDLLAIRSGSAVGRAQVVEQAFLVALAQRVVDGRLLDARGMQLLQQRARRLAQLSGELGDGSHGHVGILQITFSAARR
eukprot:m.128529 g.128529  ORF g.128529 m.128529 type:complete len:506 (-) comp52295_c0_seq7:2236-3753(-)